MNFSKKQYLVVGVSVALISFILIFMGIKVILGNQVNLKNILSFIGFSVLVGVATMILIFYRLKIALTPFMVGLVLGFFEMYRMFLTDASGWGDLIGVMFLLLWTGMGLGVGLLIQLIHYIYMKFKK